MKRSHPHHTKQRLHLESPNADSPGRFGPLLGGEDGRVRRGVSEGPHVDGGGEGALVAVIPFLLHPRVAMVGEGGVGVGAQRAEGMVEGGLGTPEVGRVVRREEQRRRTRVQRRKQSGFLGNK